MNAIVRTAYCDFGHCSTSCWKRCQIPGGRWDGAPTNLWREVWRTVYWRPKHKPRQSDLFEEAA